MSIYPTDSLFELMDFVSNKTTDTIRGGGADEQSLQSVLTGSFDEGIAFRGTGEAAVSAPSVAPDMAAGDIHGDGVDLLSSVVGTSFKQKQVDGRVMSSMLDAMMQVGNVDYGAGQGPMLPPAMQQPLQQQLPQAQQPPQLQLPAAPPLVPPPSAASPQWLSLHHYQARRWCRTQHQYQHQHQHQLPQGPCWHLPADPGVLRSTCSWYLV